MYTVSLQQYRLSITETTVIQNSVVKQGEAPLSLNNVGGKKGDLVVFSYLGETSCVSARPERRHQQPTDVSSCQGDGYVRSVMSLVQAGADVSAVWQTFVKTFPTQRTASMSQPITFQQMVVCEVLTQVCIAYVENCITISRLDTVSPGHR